MQCLEGEPLRLVRGCQLSTDPEEGYRQAQRLLNERYGHPIRQALAFKGKLMSWSPVRTSVELTNFCIHLQQCKQVKLNGGGLQELDSASTLLSVATKLPERMQFSWQTKVVDVETKEGRKVNFEDFVKFVQRHESARSHPVFGKLGSDRRDNSATTSKAKVLATGAATTSEVREELTLRTDAKTTSGEQGTRNAFAAPCLFCKGDHATSKCKTHSITREQKTEKLRGLCFACLKPGHSARHCKFRLKCDHCGGLHPTVLHDDSFKTKKSKQAQETSSTERKEEEDTPIKTLKENSLLTLAPTQYAMATVRVRAWLPRVSGQPDKCTILTALLDAASSATFISSHAADVLGAQVRTLDLQLSTMAGETAMQTGAIQNLRISDVDGNNVFPVGLAYVVESLPDVGTSLQAEEAKQLPHLSDIPLEVFSGRTKIHMLIGQNVLGVHAPDEVRRGADNELFAVRTKLGWTLQGPLNERLLPHREVVNCTKVCELKDQLNRLYFTEFQDAYNFSERGASREDKEWQGLVDTSTRRLETSHYSISLPFKTAMPTRLVNNRAQADQRLRCLKRRFERDEAFKRDYFAFVQKMIAAGHVERVIENEPFDAPRNGINYIPHHGVYHPQKKKIRVVFNCANKYQGVSLNDCLMSGPDLTNSIVGVLIRFRQFRVAFTADVEAMFYQVFVPENERDFLRFLWWEGEGMEKAVTYRMKVHLFGATSSPSIANYALRRSAAEAHTEKLVSKEAKAQAVNLAGELITACRYGGFNLAKFVSTSINVLRALEKSQLAKELEEVNLSNNKADPLGSLQERALGVTWDVKHDKLGFRVTPIQDNKATKRTVLSRLSQVYDPLGMAAPVVIVARTFFRDLTTKDNSKCWDEPLDAEEDREWQKWISSLTNLRTANIDRWLGLKQKQAVSKERYQLHAFCDVSTKAYAAAVYVRIAREDGKEAQVSFVFGKARVAPPKVVTVPRLELTAAKLAADLIDMVQKEMEAPIESRILWSDSQSTLKYLNNRSKRFHVFVANRVEAILNKTASIEWRYVPTKLNPADEGTRGLTAHNLDSSAWLNGPSFLRLPQDEWPERMELSALTEEDPEVKTTKGAKETSLMITTQETEPTIEQMASRYSAASRLCKSVAVWHRVKDKLLGKELRRGQFQLHELRRAETSAIRWLQMETWSREISKLQEGRQPAPWLRQLTPCIKEGLLVANTRTRKELPIVPDGPMARLLTREAHIASAHLGRQTTMAMVRRKYWIVHLSSIARKVVKECPWCQLRKAQPMSTQMSPLPAVRLTPGPPFQTTGVDFFGPFYARRARSTTKAYGVIFTCAVSRAIHLEMAESLATSSFVNALRRFCARRGGVKRIISDNGGSFEGACSDFQREMASAIEAHRADPTVVNQMRDKGIEWQFLPPTASHFGGFYERLIRSVRRVLDALLNPQGRQATLTHDTLTTLFCECECILNDRPLTSISSDPSDFEALTPNHLLLGRPSQGSSTPPGTYENVVKAIRYRWKEVQHYAVQFWQRWTIEYKTQLHKRSKWYEKTKRPIQPNDIVLLLESLPTPRKYWKLGRVKAVYHSADKETRVADVMTAQGSCTRPITKMCLLEAASSED